MTWAEAREKVGYADLTPEEQDYARQRFFQKHIAPGIPESEINAAWEYALPKLMDTGQSYAASLLNAAGRGLATTFTAPIAGVGALGESLGIPGGDSLREFGNDLTESANRAMPVNPANEGIGTAIAGGAGQGVGLLATGGAIGLAGKGLGLTAATAGRVASSTMMSVGVASGASEGGEMADRQDLDGVQRVLAILGTGSLEYLTEKLPFGMLAETSAVRRMIGDTPGTATTFTGTLATNSAEEVAATTGQNVLENALAAPGADTPGLFDNTLQAAFGGLGGGLVFAGANAMAGSQSQPQSLPSELNPQTVNPDPNQGTTTAAAAPLTPITRTFNGRLFDRDENGVWTTPATPAETALANAEGQIVLDPTDATGGNLIPRLNAMASQAEKLRQPQQPPQQPTVDNAPIAAQTQPDDTATATAQPPPKTGTDATSPARSPGSKLQAAAAHLRASLGASPETPRGNDRSTRSEAERNALIEWADQNALLRIRQPGTPIGEGSEHTVTQSPNGPRVLKATLPGRFGNTTRNGPGLQSANPLQYLERMIADNETFDSDIELEGVLPDGRILISQPFYQGSPPTETEVETFLDEAGFTPRPDGSYFNEDTQQFLEDTHIGNFIKIGETIVPIDVRLTPTPSPEPGAAVGTAETNTAPPTFTGSTQPPGPSEGQDAGPMSATAPAGGPAASGQPSTTPDPLPDPTGGNDIISIMQGERLRLGQPQDTAEWEWYRQLEREASNSPLRQQSAEAAARRGELDDAKAMLAWVNTNILGGNTQIDEAAATLADNHNQNIDAASLGPAILDTVNARLQARQQPDPMAQLEREQLDRERAAQRALITASSQSTGQERSVLSLATELADGDTLTIGGQSWTLRDLDPDTGTATLVNAQGQPAPLNAEDLLTIEAINGQPLDPSNPSETSDPSDMPFSLAPEDAFPQVPNPQRQTIIDRLKAKLGAIVQTSYPAANRYADMMLSYFAGKAGSGRLDANDWSRPRPPIYRPGYATHQRQYDQAAEAVRQAVQEAAQDIVNQPGYSLADANTANLQNQTGRVDTAAGPGLQTQTQAPSLPSDPASRIEAVSAALRKALGLRRLPARLQIVHTTAPVTLANGTQRQWQARVRSGRIEINAANIPSAESALWNLEHELAHEAFRDASPALKRAWNRLTQSLANHPDIRAEVETLRYTPDQLTEEQAVRLAQQLDAQGPWSAAWAALKEAIYDLLTGQWGNLTPRFTDRIAAALAARAIMANARRRLRPDPSDPAELAAYLATPEAAALSLKPSDLQPDGTPKPEALAEIEKEKAEIKARAQADGTWMKAPNGQPSKLNEGQWVAVRTRRFKEWFGDWETLAQDAAWKQRVTDYFANPNQRQMMSVGRVSAILSAAGVSDAPLMMPPSVIGKSTGGKHTLTREIVEQIPAALRNPIFVFDSATEADAVTVLTEIKHNGRNVLAAIHLDQPAPNKPGNLILSLHERPASQVQGWIRDGLLRYAHQKKARAYFLSAQLQLPREGSKAGNKNLLTEAEVVNDAVNPDSVSKVVDENGEPMVVWHNSEAKFTTFDLSRARTSSDIQALFFKDREDPYNEYGRNRYPSFLNLRNPANYRQAMAGFDAASTDDAGTRQRKKLQSEGFDGFWISEEDGGMDYAELGAFSPTQIKSATANTGTYSAETGDIRYSFAPDPSQSPLSIDNHPQSLQTNGNKPLIDDETLAALPSPLGDHCRRFLQTAEEIRRRAGPAASRGQLEAQQVRVAQALATDAGTLIPEAEFSRHILVSDSTSEHQVRRRESDGRAVKRTNPGFFGQVPFITAEGSIDRRTALPAEYLDRTALQAAVFGDDIRLEGVSIAEGPSYVLFQNADQPTFIISQVWYDKAREVAAEDVNTTMRELGFIPTKGYFAWYRPADRVLVTDARTDNFIATDADTTPGKGVKPIDLQVAVLTPEESRRAKLPEPPPLGRAQPLDSPVLTPDGYRPIGTLAIGDAIISTDGRTSTVTGTYPQGRKQVFKLTLADGRTVRATEDHLWKAQIGSVKSGYTTLTIPVTTKTLAWNLAKKMRVKLPVMLS
jgi:hypothetical protein